MAVGCGQGGNEPADSSTPDSSEATQSTTTADTTTSTTTQDGVTSGTVSETTTTAGTTANTSSGATEKTTKPAETTSRKVTTTMTTIADKVDSLLDYSKYTLEAYTQPVWKGNTMYNEIVMFYPNGQTKAVDPAPLLYTPKKVVSVRS